MHSGVFAQNVASVKTDIFRAYGKEGNLENFGF